MGAEETTVTRINYCQRDLWARFNLIGDLLESFSHRQANESCVSLHQVPPVPDRIVLIGPGIP